MTSRIVFVSAVGSVLKSLTSAPPLKMLLAPVKTTPLTEPSFSAALTASRMVSENLNPRALIGGLSSVKTRTPSTSLVCSCILCRYRHLTIEIELLVGDRHHVGRAVHDLLL